MKLDQNVCSRLHSRGQIGDPILMKLDQKFVLTISWPSSKMGHVE